MAEERIVSVNLRKQLVKVPRWRRKDGLVRLLKRKMKLDNVAVSQKLNEKLWKGGRAAFRVKIVKDGKIVKLEPVE
ncbi:MAG: hypothetical protein HYT70_04145 [Candidatus Aenigmarchaeota archaeon]|nr:hypothetical protein [Candidatus Aenigmarchaeota archaeon]